MNASTPKTSVTMDQPPSTIMAMPTRSLHSHATAAVREGTSLNQVPQETG